MVNEEQQKILEKGGFIWSSWRRNHPDVKVELNGAVLSGAYLGGANLRGAYLNDAYLNDADLNSANLSGAYLINANLNDANLSRAYLINANLSEADLNNANLSGANFNDANLSGAYLINAKLSGVDLLRADLSEANLVGANLNHATLSEANLRGADLGAVKLKWANLKGAHLESAELNGVNLSGANLTDANLSGAIASGTQFTDIDLSEVEGLDQMKHDGPSSIGLDTIRLSKGKLPIEFLRGCGLSDYDIKAVKLYDPDLSVSQYNDLLYELSALRNSDAINFHSCFISYSSQNEALARKLYTDLQESGVRCWYAPEDLKIGEKISTSIDQAISMHQKLLLIISKDSIESNWVEREVERAIRREGAEKIDMIFPIRLDDDIMQIEEGWAAYVRNLRHIGDFREWQNEASYKKAFERLKQDLQQNVERDNGE